MPFGEDAAQACQATTTALSLADSYAEILGTGDISIYGEEINTTTPTFLGHCEDINMIDVKLGSYMHETLTTLGMKVTPKRYRYRWTLDFFFTESRRYCSVPIEQGSHTDMTQHRIRFGCTGCPCMISYFNLNISKRKSSDIATSSQQINFTFIQDQQAVCSAVCHMRVIHTRNSF